MRRTTLMLTAEDAQSVIKHAEELLERGRSLAQGPPPL